MSSTPRRGLAEGTSPYRDHIFIRKEIYRPLKTGQLISRPELLTVPNTLTQEGELESQSGQ